MEGVCPLFIIRPRILTQSHDSIEKIADVRIVMHSCQQCLGCVLTCDWVQMGWVARQDSQ